MAEIPAYLSPSSSAAFSGCPLRWRFKYVDRQPEPAGQPALVGTFAHRVLEALCELPPTERTQDRAKQLARDVWPSFVLEESDFERLELDDAGSRAFRWQAWLAIAGLWHLEDPGQIEVVSTEQKIRVDLGSVPFVGIVDRVERLDGKLVVADYKSGKLPRPQFRSDKIQQVMLYAAALAESTGELPDRARLLYLGQRTLDVRVTERRVEDAVGELNQVWSQIGAACESDTFEPRPTVLCGWCPFLSACPSGQAEVERRRSAGTLPAHAPAADIDIKVDVGEQLAAPVG